MSLEAAAFAQRDEAETKAWKAWELAELRRTIVMVDRALAPR